MQQVIFVSVGRTLNTQQESFVTAVEAFMRAQSLEPRTIGRNYFRNDQPLKTVADCMKECSGAIVVAFERIHIEKGSEKRGTADETDISGLNVPTVWNQIEAALAYAHHRPLLVLVEKGLKCEGLLETGYDWWVQRIDFDPSSLVTPEFTQIFNDWKTRCSQAPDLQPASVPPKSAADLSVGELLGSLKVTQLWAVLGALAGLIAAIAATAYKLGGK